MRSWVCVLLAVTLGGCRESAFQAASKADTVSAYTRFIAEHPDDPDLGAAHARLEALAFQEAKAAHTVVAYKRFLELYPEAAEASAARSLLEGLRFNVVRDRPTLVTLRQFLKDHPQGANAAEAERMLADLELSALNDADSPQALAQLVAQHPEDPRAVAAEAKLDDVAFASATTASQLFGYLRNAPAGRHRDEARVRLLELELQGLLISGEVARARALVKGNPLGPKLLEVEARLLREERVQTLGRSSDERVRRALAGYWLRPFEELLEALSTSDPIDRWQAAEELGEVTSVRVLDPLLEQIRSGRTVLVRQRAFESLRRVIRALPHQVADYEIAKRLEVLQAEATDVQLLLTVAVLHDVGGQLELAGRAYQRAFDQAAPDPFVLRRWAQLRAERRQFFSSAVVARQLAAWAADQAAEVPQMISGGALVASRALCGAAESAQVAVQLLRDAGAAPTEFPDDVQRFTAKSEAAMRLVQARLRDAELALLTQNPGAKRCDDGGLKERLREGERSRQEALQSLSTETSADAKLVREVALERDPSPEVRRAVHAAPLRSAAPRSAAPPK